MAKKQKRNIRRLARGKKDAKRRDASARRPASDAFIFSGVAIVRKGERGGLETFIVPSREAAEAMPLTDEERRFAITVLAGGGRNCNSKSQAGRVCCIKNMCPHNCHLYRAPIPLPETWKAEDLGENEKTWVPKAPGFGYWCGCDSWDDG